VTSAAVKALATELEQIRTQGLAISKEFEGKALPAEKRTELDALLTKAGEIKAKIVEEEDREAKARDLADLDTFLNQPQYRVPRGVGEGESETHSALKSAGWEVKAGMVVAPTSLGKMVEMYPEEVLFGPIPVGDQDSAEYIKSTRAAFQPEYRKSFLKFFRLAIRFRDPAMAMMQLEPAEMKALSEGIDTAGGYLVPPDVQAEVLVRLPMLAVMRPLARVVTTSRDVLRFPRVQANSTSGSIYSSGFVGDWAGETPAFSDVDAAFGTFEVAIKKIRVATKLSNDLIADAVYNPLAFLATDGSRNMALVEDNGFVGGVGDALHPTGVLNGGSTTVDITGTTAHTISNTTANLGSATKIMNVQAQLPEQYQSGATWLMHRLSRFDIRSLVDGQGRFIWAQGFQEQLNELLGKPLKVSDFMTRPAAANDKGLVYGDFSAYIIGQRAQITTTILRERFADTDQTGIILWERVGGGVWNLDAFRVGNVT
jgi:HK97 family phage major capsid protein